MSLPSFLTPAEQHGARLARRRRRRIIAIAFVLLAAGAAAAVLVLRGGSHAHRASASAHHGGRRLGAPAADQSLAAPPSPALSPAGLPLGHPRITLSGLAIPSRDAVTLPFHHPPRAGLLVDLDSGRVLWQRNPLRELPIASLTKMMTALIAVRALPPQAPVLITRQAVDAGGSKVGVLPLGRHVRLESMLYGLLLPSGNDAADAIAQAVAGSNHAFVERMNAEAAKLGLGCTRFSSPSGYYDAGNFSCAADLAVLARIDLDQRRIARVTHTLSAVLPFPIKGGRLYLYNNNPMLIYGYPGTTGLKTGFTDASGRCLVATAERHGVRLAAILLNSREPATQARKLLDAAFAHVYGQRPLREPPMPSGA